MKKYFDGAMSLIIVLTAYFLVMIPIWVGMSYMEMRSFNKYSDKKVTLIDAMFVRLRINE